MSLDKRVVLIAGATGEVGPEVASAFAQRGARLVLAARRADALAALTTDLNIAGDRVFVHPTDVTDRASVDGMVAAALNRFGRIDAMVSLVGGFRASTVAETTHEDIDALMKLNVGSLVTLCGAVVPTMQSAGRGAIVTVASKLGLKAMAGVGAYAASKAAVLRLTEALAAELRPHGIRANAVAPGTIDTKINRAAMPTTDRSNWVAPGKLAQVIAYLASDESEAISGATIEIG